MATTACGHAVPPGGAVGTDLGDYCSTACVLAAHRGAEQRRQQRQQARRNVAVRDVRRGRY